MAVSVWPDFLILSRSYAIKWGVPHIYAQNEHDLFFAQGYVHAQDRLFQMDTHRRVGAGRISEIAGPSGLATDRFARYFGWPRVAEAQVRNVGTEVAECNGGLLCRR